MLPELEIGQRVYAPTFTTVIIRKITSTRKTKDTIEYSIQKHNIEDDNYRDRDTYLPTNELRTYILLAQYGRLKDREIIVEEL